MDLKAQLRSVIEWTNPAPDVLFMKWTEDGDEIKNASKLIVGPGLGCIFVYEGKVAAHFDKEGLVNLKTDNVPFWTTVKSFMQKLESEHKVGIFYYRRAECPNIRWGTPAPIKYLDPMFRFPVGLGAFGNYSVKIRDSEAFFKNIVAGAEFYGVRDLQKLILSRITPLVSDILGKAKFSYVDVDGHRAEISTAVVEQVGPVFKTLGFDLTDFRIEGTSFDDETQARINKIADMAAAGQAAAAAGIDYAQMMQLEALTEAAKNQNSVAGTAMGLTAGMGLGAMLGGVFNPPGPGGRPAGPVNPFGAAPQAAAPAAAPAGDDMQAKLVKLKGLFDAGLISADEFAAKKKELLDKL